jgi:hypothetical protein
MNSQTKKKSPNPHPHKNQQIFVKFGQEVHLLKHRGLLTTTRKPKPKKISKPEPTQETQPTHQVQPTTPCPRRKVSENFTEIFKMFNKANPSTQQEPGKPVPTSRPVKSKPKDTNLRKPKKVKKLISSHCHHQQDETLTALENHFPIKNQETPLPPFQVSANHSLKIASQVKSSPPPTHKIVTLHPPYTSTFKQVQTDAMKSETSTIFSKFWRENPSTNHHDDHQPLGPIH